VSNQSHHGHIFLRVRRGPIFRWNFPVRLYDHMALYRLIRHPWIEMGVNDSIQCADAWLPPERCAETGETVRRVDGDDLRSRGLLPFAIAFLRGRADARRLTIRLQARGRPEASQVEGGVRLRSAAREHDVLLMQ